MSNSNAGVLGLAKLDRQKIPLRVITLSVAMVAGAYLAIAILADLDSVLQAMASIPVSLWLVLLCLSVTSYTLRFLRWFIFLRPLNPEICTRKHLAIYFSGFALTMSPGKMGEMLRSFYLQPLGISYPESIAAFLSERFLDVFVVAALALLAIEVVVLGGEWSIVFLLFAAALFLFLRSRMFPRFIERLFARRFGVLAGEVQEGMNRFMANGTLPLVVLLGVLAWVSQGLTLSLIVEGFGYEVGTLRLVGFYCLSILAGAASLIPGGMGATEAAIALLLMGVGVEPAYAVAASLISRLVTLWFAVAIGMLSLFFVREKGDGFN